MENHPGPVSGLEDRLRGLILANSDDGHQQFHPSGVVQGNAQPMQTPLDLPRDSVHWAKALDSPGPFKTHKRPNQAQRRQMAAELSIPVDTRPEPVTTVRQHANYPRQHNQAFSSAARGGGYRGNQNLGPAGRGDVRREYGHRSAHSQQVHPGHMAQNRHASHQQHRQSHSHGGPQFPDNAENWRQGQQGQQQGRPQASRLYQPGDQQVKAQALMLEKLGLEILANAEISIEELTEKENFRLMLEQVCREVVVEHGLSTDGVPIAPHTVELKCFGSLASGFATKAADMDLALLSPQSTIQPDAPGSPIPRLLEKAFLQMGIGARLLTRTRVPIIKVCERPPEHLRADLLAYRLKWEAGENVDVGGPDEEQPDEPVTTVTPEESPDESAAPPLDTDRQSGEIVELQQQKRDAPAALDEGSDFAMKLASLKQSGMSFNSYCGSVKTLIRKMGGGFDLNQANAQTLTPDIRSKLGAVCHAFVSGLADEGLKKRLFSYHSLSAMHCQCRTLQGVLIQAEGEMLAMGWLQRPLPEKDERQEEYAQQAISDWTRIQNKEDFHVDAIGYQRQLFHAVERLKRIPSLQLISLQQAEFESAAAYHLRAVQLMVELGGADSQDASSDKVLPIIISRYVAGIYNPEIRSDLEVFVSTRGPRSLRSIARRHKSLQLAHDFQKALLNGNYQESEAEIVRRYVACLRDPMKSREDEPYTHLDTFVPLTPSDKKEVLPVIKRLGNPGNLALNQPRDRYQDHLEFPKTGAGVQCDVNFSAHLALHNTALLRCYSYTDPRVKPLVLFVKHWAKVRGINNPYRGSLSSYGYVLMVLHYLVNVVRPFVCPNLQLLAPPDDPNMPPEHYVCKGYNVRFWRDEATIRHLASQNQLNQNNQSLGYLLRGFFEYYAYSGNMSSYLGVRGFDWGRDTISLRTPRGILKKEEKGWTGAKTVKEVKTVAAPPGTASTGPNQNLVHGLPATQEVREVRHRYLFAIEDPFETEHNVARTVTHTGIVAIRDEFRRAWRLIRSVGAEGETEDLLEDASKTEQERNREQFAQLLLEIHGKHVFDAEMREEKNDEK